MRNHRLASSGRRGPPKAGPGGPAGFPPPPAAIALFLAVLLVPLPCLPAAAERCEGKAPAENRLAEPGSAEPDEGREAGRRPVPPEFELAGVAARLSGLLELNFEYLDHSDTGDGGSRRRRDFFVSSLGLALRLFFNDWSKAKLAVAAEDIGKEGGGRQTRPRRSHPHTEVSVTAALSAWRQIGVALRRF